MSERVQMSTRVVFHFFSTLFPFQVKTQPFSCTELERKAKFLLIIDIRKTLAVGVTHDISRADVLDGPERWEAARRNMKTQKGPSACAVPFTKLKKAYYSCWGGHRCAIISDVANRRDAVGRLRRKTDCDIDPNGLSSRR